MSAASPSDLSSDSSSADFTLRSLRGFAPLIWFAGLAAGFALSWDPLLEHLGYIEASGDVYYRALLAGLAVLLAALPLYQWIRRRGLWRYELLVLAAWPLAVCLLREPMATFTILWMLTACYLVGGLVLDKLNLDIESDAESFSLLISVGMGLLVCALFVLGMTGAFYWWVFALLFTLPCALLFRRFRRLGVLLKRFHRKWTECEEMSSAPWDVTSTPWRNGWKVW